MVNAACTHLHKEAKLFQTRLSPAVRCESALNEEYSEAYQLHNSKKEVDTAKSPLRRSCAILLASRLRVRRQREPASEALKAGEDRTSFSWRTLHARRSTNLNTSSDGPLALRAARSQPDSAFPCLVPHSSAFLVPFEPALYNKTGAYKNIKIYLHLYFGGWQTVPNTLQVAKSLPEVR
jgi:hypothetical protein